MKNINTHFLFSVIFSENPSVYEMVWKKNGRAKEAIQDNTIWRMNFACWIIKVKNTHSKYVILIAFHSKKLSPERASILRYTCISYIVYILVLFMKATH